MPRIYISHSAPDGDGYHEWFVVQPIGAGEETFKELASLTRAKRTIISLDIAVIEPAEDGNK